MTDRDTLKRAAELLREHFNLKSEVAAALDRMAEQEAMKAEIARLRTALRFYARGEHYQLDEAEEFDTVSGEPTNWLCSGREDSTTMVENGRVAKLALEGVTPDWTDGDKDCAPQPKAPVALTEFMNLDRFGRIAQMLGNTTWVRTYLTSFPGRLVLEVANVDEADLSGLRSEMLGAGFREMLPVRRRGIEMARFAVDRTDDADDAGAAELSDADIEQRR